MCVCTPSPPQFPSLPFLLISGATTQVILAGPYTELELIYDICHPSNFRFDKKIYGSCFFMKSRAITLVMLISSLISGILCKFYGILLNILCGQMRLKPELSEMYCLFNSLAKLWQVQKKN